MAYREISFCLFKVLFKGRKQRTVLNGQNPLWGDVSAEAPQGSILEPLCFFVHINDLAADVKCNVNLFADDASLFKDVEDTHSSDVDHGLELLSRSSRNSF